MINFSQAQSIGGALEKLVSKRTKFFGSDEKLFTCPHLIFDKGSYLHLWRINYGRLV